MRSFVSQRIRRQRGFTLIEFFVAIGLLAVLMVAVSESFTFQQQTYVVVDQVAEAKQNVRVVADLVQRELRNAGYMVPTSGGVCGVDDDAGPDKLYISNAAVLAALNEIDSDKLPRPLGAEILNAPIAGIGAGTQTITLETLDIDEKLSANDFSVGAGVILADRNGAYTGVACGTITNIPNVVVGGIPIQVEMEEATGGLSTGTELVAIPAIVYEVIGNQLLRNGVVIVDQIDDFQIAWFFDLDGNRLVDPGEYFADGDGAIDDYDASDLDASMLLEVRINVVIRTRDEDPRDWQGGIGQVVENRDPNSIGPADGARRRSYTSTVRLRNNVM